MSREPILQDLDELLQATELLVEGCLGYREALSQYEQALFGEFGTRRVGGRQWTVAGSVVPLAFTRTWNELALRTSRANAGA